jgi:hypothetical protein
MGCFFKRELRRSNVQMQKNPAAKLRLTVDAETRKNQ